MHRAYRVITSSRLVPVVGCVLLVGAALARELRQPQQERTWHGRIAGIPYDFRLPTRTRLRAEWWNPAEPSLLTPHSFGVGWSINLYRLAHPMQSAQN